MKTIVVDIDGTIVQEKPTFERSLAGPFQGAAQRLKDLKNEGYTIILHTARGWSEYRMTTEQLAKYGIVYDQLIMGKPVADYIIDDRAIKFTNWDAAYGEINGMRDETNLYMVRHATYEFIKTIGESDIPKPILEVGPMNKETMPFPEFYINLQGYVEKVYTLDKDPNAIVDFNIDLDEIDKAVEEVGLFGSIVMCNVMEHISRPWELEELLFGAMQPNGMLFILTPFNLRLHGPDNDTWRFTDLAYSELFRRYFDIIEIKKWGDDPLNPYAFSAIMRKI